MNARNQYAILTAEIILAAILIIVMWDQIPATVPIRFDIHGEAARFGPKASVWALPAIMLFIAGLTSLLPYIDPKKYVREYMHTYRSIAIICNTFMAVIMIYLMGSWLGYFPAEGGRYLVPVISMLLFVALGNYFAKLKPNYFIGIRVPWTLANETVWLKTHRMAAYLWVIASLVMIPVYMVLPDEAAVVAYVTYLIVLIVLPVIYSFVLFRKMQGGETQI